MVYLDFCVLSDAADPTRDSGGCPVQTASVYRLDGMPSKEREGWIQAKPGSVLLAGHRQGVRTQSEGGKQWVLCDLTSSVILITFIIKQSARLLMDHGLEIDVFPINASKE